MSFLSRDFCCCVADEICRLCSKGIAVLVLPTIGNGLEAKVFRVLKGCPLWIGNHSSTNESWRTSKH